jgi:hypothetical protein
MRINGFSVQKKTLKSTISATFLYLYKSNYQLDVI